MSVPIMPLATAVWLIDNTSLTFRQIADFCGLHVLEIQAIADGQAAVGIKGLDPVALGQLSREELDRCLKDPEASLVQTIKYNIPHRKEKSKFKRLDKLNAVAWILENSSSASEKAICKLAKTTVSVVRSVKNKTHDLMDKVVPTNPVTIGLCSEADWKEFSDS